MGGLFTSVLSLTPPRLIEGQEKKEEKFLKEEKKREGKERGKRRRVAV